MTISLKPIDQLDSELVLAQMNQLVARVTEDNPTLQVQRGVFRDTLAYYHALAAAGLEDLLNQYAKARSMAAIAQDPASADPDLVDDVLSTFGVVRRTGSKAYGQIVVVVNSDTSITLGRGVRFQGRGVNFATTGVMTAKADEDLIVASTDRLITPLGDGTYQFLVDVTADDVGDEYNLPRGTSVVPLDSAIPGYVNSYAYADFVAGTNDETNAELLARVQEGIAAPVLGNRVNMQASLRATEQFGRIVRSSIIGLGQAEMQRNRHSVMPIAAGGCIDWYVRTVPHPGVVVSEFEAVRIADEVEGYGVYRVALPRTFVPGFYLVQKIWPKVAPSFVSDVLTDARGFDSTSDDMPDIELPEEAAYSAYQTAILTFLDRSVPASSSSVGDKKTFVAEVLAMPLIQELQTHVRSLDVRNFGTDCLVKAPVPCFLSVTVDVDATVQSLTPNTDAIKTAIVDAIAKIGWTGRVYAASLAKVITPLLTTGMEIKRIGLTGKLRTPSGTIVYYQGSDAVEIVEEPTKGISYRTVQFYGAVENVSVNVNREIPVG